VQHGDGGHELPNEAQRRIDIELQSTLAGDAQNLRQPRAFDMIRDDGERAVRLHAIDAAHARVVRVSKVHEPRGPLAQRELERRHGRQRRPQPQDLQQLAGGGIRSDHAFAKTVGEQWRLRAID
jgi:hypothetical protein